MMPTWVRVADVIRKVFSSSEVEVDGCEVFPRPRVRHFGVAAARRERRVAGYAIELVRRVIGADRQPPRAGVGADHHRGVQHAVTTELRDLRRIRGIEEGAAL